MKTYSVLLYDHDPDDGTPPHFSGELAGCSEYLRLAAKIANRKASQWRMHHLRDDMVSIAFLALVSAARTFDLSKSGSFKDRLCFVVDHALRDFRRDQAPKGFRRKKQPAPQISDGVDLLPSRNLPVGWEVESLDAVDGLTRTLAPARARLLRRRFGVAGVSIRQLAKEEGVSQSRIFQCLSESLEKLRKELTR